MFTRCIGSSLLVGSAYHKNTNAKSERVNGVLGDTLRAFANGRKGDWDSWLPYAVFAINNSASTLGGDLTPFFIDHGSHPRLPLSLPDLRDSGESPAAYASRMKDFEKEVRALLYFTRLSRPARRHWAAVGSTRSSRWATRYCFGPGSCGTRRRSGSCGHGGKAPFASAP